MKMILQKFRKIPVDLNWVNRLINIIQASRRSSFENWGDSG